MVHMEPSVTDTVLGTHPSLVVTSGKSGASWTDPQPDTSALPVPSAEPMEGPPVHALTELELHWLVKSIPDGFVTTTRDAVLTVDNFMAVLEDLRAASNAYWKHAHKPIADTRPRFDVPPMPGTAFADEWWELAVHDSGVV